MTLTPVLTPSWVTIDLDTTPPLLHIDAPASVEPPDPWIVIVRSNEDLGPVGMQFTDAYGTTSSVGYERIGPRTLAVTLPTVGLSGGAGELKIVAQDGACNPAIVVVTVAIARPRAFDVTLTVEPSISAEVGLTHSYDVESEITATIGVSLEVTDAP